jgi:hypothetical protein
VTRFSAPTRLNCTDEVFGKHRVVSCWGRGVPWELRAMDAPARDRLLNPACDSETREAKQRAANPGSTADACRSPTGAV